jgi:hypothetical protein
MNEEKIDCKKLNIPLAIEYFCSIKTCLRLLESCKDYLYNFVPKDDMETTIKTLTTLEEKRGWR